MKEPVSIFPPIPPNERHHVSKKFREEASADEAPTELVVEGFNPDAVDGDKDGFVQDGTQFERPTETTELATEEVAPAEEVAPVYVPYNLLDEEQFLVRFLISDGRIFREFCISAEQAVAYKAIYSAAAEEKGLTLVSASKA